MAGNHIPETDIKKRAPKLYSLRSILLGTVIGGPVAAAILIGGNFYAFGQMRKAALTWLFAGAFIALSVLADRFIGFSSTLAFNFLALLVAVWVFNTFQGGQMDECVASGDPVHPNWRGALVGGIIFILMMMMANLTND